MSQDVLPQINADAGKTVNRTLVLFIICFLAILSTFMVSALNVALPVVNLEFKVNAIVLNWIVASYILTMAIFSVPFGRIADIVGIKKIFLLGVAVYILASLGVIFARSASILIVIRLLQGLGGAMISATSMAILTASFPGNQRGRALGIYTACVYAGLSIGPLLGGIITEHSSWRFIFLAPAPLCLLVLGLTLWKVKSEWAESKGEKFDYLGSLIFGLSLAAIMYGFSLLPAVPGGIFTLIGILGIVGFLFYENSIPSPVLNIGLFKNNRIFVFSNLAALINYTATAGIAFLLSLYLQYIKGFSAETAGFVLITQPVIMAVVSPFAGRLSDRVETRTVASIGMSLVCLGLISFALLTAATSVVLIIISLVVLGTGFAFFSSPNMNAIMSSVKPKYYAVASSLTSTMRNLGQTLGNGICMVVFAVIIGRVVIGPENYLAFLSSAKIAFAIFACLCFVGVFASLARGNSNRQ
jgi:EmrB/QacA subfamily drug resistance transporter